jgi:hypothetical protein
MNVAEIVVVTVGTLGPVHRNQTCGFVVGKQADGIVRKLRLEFHQSQDVGTRKVGVDVQFPELEVVALSIALEDAVPEVPADGQ